MGEALIIRYFCAKREKTTESLTKESHKQLSNIEKCRLISLEALMTNNKNFIWKFIKIFESIEKNFFFLFEYMRCVI